MIHPGIIAVFMFMILAAIGFISFAEMNEVADLIEHCKDNGYDGIRYEQVNFFREESQCTNFTVAEKFKMERNKEFDEAGVEVLAEFLGRRP